MNFNQEFEHLSSNQVPDSDRDLMLARNVRKIEKKRFLVILLVLLILILAVSSVFGLDYQRKQRYLAGYDKLECQSSDNECYQQLCPDGMFWNKKTDTCHVHDQSFCCKDEDRILRCTSVSQEESVCSRVQVAGVGHSAYKLFCRRGFLWVPWKKRCFRAIEQAI